MKARARRAAVLLLTLGACAREARQSTTPEPRSDKAVLFITADLRGYLAPCGCSENMRGGIARAAYQIARARSEGLPVWYVDSGNALFGARSLPDEAVPQQERKARALADAMRLMGVDARASHGFDDARGADFRRAMGLPDLPLDSAHWVSSGGHRVAVLSVADPAKMGELSRAARSQGADYVVALVHHPLDVAQKAAQSSDADLVVAGHAANELAGEENRLVQGDSAVLQIQNKGRSLVRVDLTFAGRRGQRFALRKGQGDLERELAALDARIEMLRREVNSPSLREEMKRAKQAKLEELTLRREQRAATPLPAPADANTFAVRFIPLESNFPSLSEVKNVVATYDREVGELNLAWAKAHGRDCPPAEPGKAAFVGNGECRKCHAAAFAVWEGSKHSRAYRTLEEAGKQLHLDCVQCHVTGANLPGGVCRLDKLEGRKDVGCESCHGPGSLHAAAPRKTNIHRAAAAERCVGCHDPENSPHFEFPSYVAQILGPGHGAPPGNGGAEKSRAPAKP